MESLCHTDILKKFVFKEIFFKIKGAFSRLSNTNLFYISISISHNNGHFEITIVARFEFMRIYLLKFVLICKDIFMFFGCYRLDQKTNEFFLRISALKKTSYQKNKDTLYH